MLLYFLLDGCVVRRAIEGEVEDGWGWGRWIINHDGKNKLMSIFINFIMTS